VELAKFSSDGRYLVTGGMNNLLRVWDVDAGFSLKLTIDSIP
jgi:WD40 repeat protein